MSEGKVSHSMIENVIKELQPIVPDDSGLKLNGSAVPQAPVKLQGLDAIVHQPLLAKSLDEERNDLRRALSQLSPLAKHGKGEFVDGQYWSAVILSIASLGDDFKDIALEWSNQKGANFSIDAFNKAWDSYDPNATGHDGKPMGIGSLYWYVNRLSGEGSTGKLGDIKNGETYATQFKNQILFIRDTVDDAIYFDPNVGWVPAYSDHQIKGAKIIANEMTRKATAWRQREPDNPDAKKSMAEAFRASSERGLKSMVWSAKSVDGMSVNADQLDNQHHLLGVQNGILNLDTGELLAPDPSILVTKRANVTYDPDARCPRYLQFLKEIHPDPEVVEFKIRWEGYNLSGSTKEQKFLFKKGKGANGKTVELETKQYILGDYADTFKTDFLVNASRDPQGHDADILHLKGLRFAWCNETSEGKWLNEQQVKLVVDTGTLSGRGVWEKKQTSFPITAKIEIAGNHAPIVRGTDDGIWRRLTLLDYPVKFHDPDDEHPEGFTGPFRDKDLQTKLRAEASGILNLWMHGYKAWKKDGLKIPDSVRKATNIYRAESDLLGTWIEECCVVAANEKCDDKRLYKAYRNWCDEDGYSPFTKRSFSIGLTQRGFLMAPNKRDRLGITLQRLLDSGL